MNDNEDWQEQLRMSQDLQKMRLMNEQTNILRGMASGATKGPDALERKLGVTRSSNPVEFNRRLKEHNRNELIKGMKISGIIVGSLLVLWIIVIIVTSSR